MHLDINGDGSLAYVPATGCAGVDAATYCITEGSASSICISSIATITITVVAAPPVLAPSTARRIPLLSLPAPATLAATGSDGSVLATAGVRCTAVGALLLGLDGVRRRCA